MRIRTALIAFILTEVCLLVPQQPSFAAKIEAIKGKKYTLTKQHGPWMIMVASFRDIEHADYKRPGMQAEQAADQLVYELRRKGIPAYTYLQKQEFDTLKTLTRAGAQDVKKYIAQQGMISVLAGNYPSLEHRVAQKTLDYVKRFQPAFLKDEKSGARMSQRSRKENRPLAQAFLTINPMLSDEEARSKQVDPLLVKLNRGMEYSLLENPAKYTLVVATFSVESHLINGKQAQSKQFLEKLQFNDDHDDAATNAYQLADAIRNATKYGYDDRFDAYLYHDRHHSIVTVGEFNSPNDPQIKQLYERFRAKVRTNPNNGQEVLTGEVFTIPRQPPIQKTWLFDPNPKLVEVPRLNRN